MRERDCVHRGKGVSTSSEPETLQAHCTFKSVILSLSRKGLRILYW